MKACLPGFSVWSQTAELLSIQVIVPQTEYRRTMFSSVTLRCDYSTSVSPQNVLLTWQYKSFCKDPVLDYYSAAYQAELALGQDPTNDCSNSQRTIRVVAQKSGTGETILGSEYQTRRITIQNKADLVISELMWWDNGVYFCTINAPGDTIGNSEGVIQLIVYNWLVVLFIILGGVLLIILLGICCCQCCPQCCCCYVRCPCCPQSCCCPEKLVMQHRMIKDAQKAMAPWLHGQPVYAPMSNVSSQMNPLLYSDPSKQGIPMTPLPLPPPQSVHPGMAHSFRQGSMQGTNMALDYLESQVRNIDVNTPVLHQPILPQPVPLQSMTLQQVPPPPQHMPQGVPFSAGPPSMLSSLNEMGVDRRVIQLPPIVERPPSSYRRTSSGPQNRPPSGHSSRASSRSGRHHGTLPPRLQDPSAPRRGILRSYSDESDLEERNRGGRYGQQYRSRSRDDLFEEARRTPARQNQGYSPPRRRGSWSSEDEGYSRNGGARSRGAPWPEKPPSYTSIASKLEKPGNKDRFSEKSSRSGTSVVI
ncbi:immunoglobulin-like domain-containing receptor 1a isoform X2 [Scleropages formosus]|uniref:immunoglobulin-like domain-containing receptor 1a isoform X2 n=1 Tax=Scleropages formosus TaxID=113540 RepID=UPI0010FA957A|nr:immunoglobulin-like domain-containing receptor 1 isoform X2 [Scleropages formosus]